MRIAIVGGTGGFGRALAQASARIGVDAVIGSRDPGRARELALALGVDGGANEEVVRDADLVVLSTRSNAALDTARQLADAIGTTPLLCVASDLAFTPTGVVPGRLGRSLAEEVSDVVTAPLAAGFQSLAAAHLMQLEPPDEDVLVCGDDEPAKRLALELGDRIVAGRAIDAGPLANARGLEAMTAVILSVNKRYRGHAGLRVVGLP